MKNPEKWRIGKTLDRRYEILSIMGIGDMAVVYKAFDHKLKRDVAIKVLRDNAAMDEDSHLQFRTEYQAIGMLSHQNIRAVYDVVASGSVEYIVMEYLDGVTLKKYLHQKGSLSWQQTLHFSLQIARALRHAHSKGVLHLDINPQNIMLLKDGTAKISDFGIARMEESSPDGLTDDAVDTRHYIAPELARGGTADARSDVYSLGVVMYEMLTGRLPFDDDAMNDTETRHLMVTPEAPSSINPDIPPELEEITLKAIRQNPKQRYSTADSMVAALENFRRIQTETIGESLSKNQPTKRDNVHVIYRDVPRVSKTGELSKKRFMRRRSRERRISNLLGFALVLIFMLGLFGYVWRGWLSDIFSDAERTDIPDFVGLVAADITKNTDLTSLFNFNIVYKADAVYDEGIITAQDPAAGSSRMIVSEGIDIELTVSSGIQLVQIPDLIYYPYTEAQMQLQALGLDVEIIMESNDYITASYVISTNPEGGTSVNSGTKVTLTVSSGPAVSYTVVPNLIGMTESEALDAINAAGLECSDTGITYVESSSSENNLVIWQNYAEGEEVVSGTFIYIQIGTGPSTSTSTTAKVTITTESNSTDTEEGTDTPDESNVDAPEAIE